MDNIDLFYYMLDLKAPWRIFDIRDDLRDGQLDVWVGIEPPRKSWIFGRTPPVQKTKDYVWRHVGLGTKRCFVHASLPADVGIEDISCFGEKGLPFSRALNLQVATLFSHGMTLQHICAVLDLPISDIWKFRHRLDSGQANLSSRSTEAGEQAVAKSAVPEPDDPMWERLLEGALTLDIRILSLKLLMNKMREQMQAITDKEVRTLKSYELQRYFAKNERQLGHELAQLRKLAAGNGGRAS